MFGLTSVARRMEARQAEARRLEDVRRVANLTPGVPSIAEVAPEGMRDWCRTEAEDLERLAVLIDLVGPYEAARQIFGGQS